MSNRDALLVKVLREKYKCGKDIIPEVRSINWDINRAWEITLKRIGWSLRNGKRMKFWEDK